MKRVMVVVLVLLCVTGTVFATGAVETTQQVYKLRSSTNLAPGGTVGRGLQYFVDELNKAAGGRIVATANFGSELGTQREQVEMAKTGSLEMVVSAPGTGPGAYVPQLQAIDLPYLFNDEDHFVRVLNGVEAEMSRLLAPHNFVAIGGQNMGFRHMLIKQRQVKTPADLPGLKMRGPNPVFVQMFQALGASGVTTDWNDVYTSLQTGVIDGMEASPDMIYSMRFQEQAKYFSKTFHNASCVFYFFNKQWLESLPADLQKIATDTARKAAAYQNKIDLEAQQASMQKMIAEGTIVNEVNDINEFKKLTAPMMDTFKARGPEWADFINKLTAIK
ncbi:MAG: ABC transporter substrate-binding protein [Spirochaetes bacterium RIFOXYC1_FULL_54_7]|nr:MAG: ABC transporter substrate-binding protein [Spirochaetes bacterium RIFOXYC1_FULL_54_7]